MISTEGKINRFWADGHNLFVRSECTEPTFLKNVAVERVEVGQGYFEINGKFKEENKVQGTDAERSFFSSFSRSDLIKELHKKYRRKIDDSRKNKWN